MYSGCTAKHPLVNSETLKIISLRGSAKSNHSWHRVLHTSAVDICKCVCWSICGCAWKHIFKQDMIFNPSSNSRWFWSCTFKRKSCQIQMGKPLYVCMCYLNTDPFCVSWVYPFQSFTVYLNDWNIWERLDRAHVIWTVVEWPLRIYGLVMLDLTPAQKPQR